MYTGPSDKMSAFNQQKVDVSAARDGWLIFFFFNSQTGLMFTLNLVSKG